MSEDDIAEGAAKLRAREAADREVVERTAIEARGRAAADVILGRQVLSRTLGPPMGDVWIVIIAILGFAAIAAVAVAVGKRHAFPVIVAATAIYMVVMIGLPRVISKLRASAANARLDRLGLGIDAAAYRTLLSQRRREGQLVLTCTTTQAIDDAKRTQIADALRGWVPARERATWEGDALVAKTGELRGAILISARRWGGRVFTNRAFHAVVLTAVEHLPKLGVEHLDIAIVGELAKLDEGP